MEVGVGGVAVTHTYPSIHSLLDPSIAAGTQTHKHTYLHTSIHLPRASEGPTDGTHRSVGTWICGSKSRSGSHFPSSPSRLGFTMRTAFWIASSKFRPMA